MGPAHRPRRAAARRGRRRSRAHRVALAAIRTIPLEQHRRGRLRGAGRHRAFRRGSPRTGLRRRRLVVGAQHRRGADRGRGRPDPLGGPSRTPRRAGGRGPTRGGDMIDTTLIGLVIAALAVIFVISRAVRIVPEYERAVIFRLGRIQETKGPGVIVVAPGVDKVNRIDLRTYTYDVPPQD